MGKMRKRLTMAKYANKYKALREALFGKKEEEVNITVEEPTPEPEVVAEAAIVPPAADPAATAACAMYTLEYEAPAKSYIPPVPNDPVLTPDPGGLL